MHGRFVLPGATRMPARQIDGQSPRDLQNAGDDRERCRGQGDDHPCPCWDVAACARV
jgi:hypothetical protein